MKKQSKGGLKQPVLDGCRMPNVPRTAPHTPLEASPDYCLDAHQHYLWDTYEDKHNNIFLKEYHSDEIGEMLKYRSPGINSLN